MNCRRQLPGTGWSWGFSTNTSQSSSSPPNPRPPALDLAALDDQSPRSRDGLSRMSRRSQRNANLLPSPPVVSPFNPRHQTTPSTPGSSPTSPRRRIQMSSPRQVPNVLSPRQHLAATYRIKTALLRPRQSPTLLSPRVGTAPLGTRRRQVQNQSHETIYQRPASLRLNTATTAHRFSHRQLHGAGTRGDSKA